MSDKIVVSYWREVPELFNESYTQKKFFTSFVHKFLNNRIEEGTSFFYGINLKNKKVLDVGCGGGQYMEFFLKRGSQVTGVDYSSKMISIANSYLKKRGYENFTLKIADASDLPFNKEVFDIVIATGLLEYLEKPNKAVSEISRVLKPNGFCLLSFSKKWSPFFFLRFFPGLILRNYLLKLPRLTAVFDNKMVYKILNENNLKEFERKEIMKTEWLVFAKKI